MAGDDHNTGSQLSNDHNEDHHDHHEGLEAWQVAFLTVMSAWLILCVFSNFCIVGVIVKFKTRP